MKLINKENISHIILIDAKKGVKYPWGNNIEYVWMEAEYFKFLWLFKTPIENYKQGYYKNRKREWLDNSEPLELNRKKHYVLQGFVHTFPHIEIYLGKDLIHTEFFSTFEEAEKHIKDNYSNCNIKYE